MTADIAARPLAYPRTWRGRHALYAKAHPKMCVMPGCGIRRRLELHHLAYSWDHPQGSEEWRSQVPDEDLCWLCAPHHDRVTALHRFKGLTPRQATRAVYLACERDLQPAMRAKARAAQRQTARARNRAARRLLGRLVRSAWKRLRR